MNNMIDYFRLNKEKEEFSVVYDTVRQGAVFKGTNVWILVFAIFIASLGLNVNSTAVIIGAMLISPLMGPIIAFGFGIAVNNLPLMKKAMINFLFATATGLVTSTIYFLLSPLNEAHSEILARTSPNIYDVLIALFGGLAGILAISSKNKGNVIPGVAIATALMPPLCTAGYGLATLQLGFFIGAFYLFVINVVFIALATWVTTRLLKFPVNNLSQLHQGVKAQRIIWGVVIITLLPSIYFGYDFVHQRRFEHQATRFIEHEAVLPNNYLLKKSVDAKKKQISLTFGGQYINQQAIDALKKRLSMYNLQDAKLEIQQGFAYTQNLQTSEDKADRWNALLSEKENQLQDYRQQLDSVQMYDRQGKQLLAEIQVQYPVVSQFGVHRMIISSGNDQKSVLVAIVTLRGRMPKESRHKLEQWLKIRLQDASALVFFQE